jgi:hypothetical protein
MKNFQKSITILENLWTFRRQLLIHKLTTRLVTAELDTAAVKFFFVYNFFSHLHLFVIILTFLIRRLAKLVLPK